MVNHEPAFLASIRVDPYDRMTKGVYADWLDDCGRFYEAEAWHLLATKKYPVRLSQRAFGVATQAKVWSWISDLGGRCVTVPWCVPMDVFEKLKAKKVYATKRNYRSRFNAECDFVQAWVEVSNGT